MKGRGYPTFPFHSLLMIDLLVVSLMLTRIGLSEGYVREMMTHILNILVLDGDIVFIS